MTRADDIIHEQRAKVAEMERTLETARAELRGMETLARAWSITVSTVLPARATRGPEKPSRPRVEATATRVGGRQPGAISRRWREVLTRLLATSNTWFDAQEVALAVRALEDREIKISEARRQLDGYIEHGFVERSDDGRYHITQTAIEKFGLNPAKDSAIERASLEENEAPTGHAEGASETGGGATPPIENRPRFSLAG